MTEPMLPCPFCGRTDLLGIERHPESGFLMVRCRACGCIGPAGRSIEGEPYRPLVPGVVKWRDEAERYSRALNEIAYEHPADPALVARTAIGDA